MIEVYLLLGSNESERKENLEKASGLIELRCGKIEKASSVYETEAWGIKEQNSFLNQAVKIATTLSPIELLASLKAIEKKTGRIETVKWGPRIIDIDILFYGSEIIDSAELIIPHPFLRERKFTLTPLNEIAGEFVHPVFKKTVRQLLMECGDNSEVKKL